jgi:hypothetical protein
MTSEPRFIVPACSFFFHVRFKGDRVRRRGSTHDKGNLQKTAKLVLVLDGSFWVHKSTLVGNSAIAPDEDVVCDSLPKDLDLEDVCDDLLRLAVEIWMYEGDVVVACDDISERGQTLFYSLEGDGVREGVAQVLELLVSRGGGYEKTISVAF